MKKQRLASSSRREFLKKAGLGSAALAMLPAFGDLLATPVLASGRTGFNVLAASGLDGDLVILVGDGQMTESEAVGGGTFVHFRTSDLSVKATGPWKAKKLNSFTPQGDPLGLASAGIADMDIDLIPANNERVEGRLRIICNLPGSGRNTGKGEGFTLTVHGNTFTQTGIGGSLFTLGVPN